MSDNEEMEPLKWPISEKKIGRLDREEVLQMATDLIEYLHSRACGLRFRPYPTDKDRAAFQRVMIAAISAYWSILKDDEIENIKRRLEALEDAKGKGKERRRANGDYN